MDFHTLLNVAEQSHEKSLERPNKFKSTKVSKNQWHNGHLSLMYVLIQMVIEIV